MTKIGLVVEGGGMKCAYNAGVLDAFLDHSISFDYCIGVSGGAGNVATFVAGQRGRNIRFFTKHIHHPEYFGFRSFMKTGNLFGLEYIYGTLTNSTGEDPIDYPAIMKSPVEYHSVATDANTGKAVYFGKEDMAQDDYRCIMASSAIPIVCKPVEIDGHFYFDGGLSDAIPVEKAFLDGCDKVVVILSKPRSYVRKPQGMHWAYSHFCSKYPKVVEAIEHRHIDYTKNQHQVFEYEKQGKAYLFVPENVFGIGTYTMDEKKEWDLYEEGIQDVEKQLSSFQEFLKSK